MRYTTIIDITEDRNLYRNLNVRLVYLHLVLIAGYHDDDRDLVDISIRRLALDVGITVSAVRHALKVLERSSLITMEDSQIIVKKWLPEKNISRRPRNARERSEQAIIEERQRQAERDQREREEKQRQAEIDKATGKGSLERHIERLEREAAAGDESAIQALKRHRKMKMTISK